MSRTRGCAGAFTRIFTAGTVASGLVGAQESLFAVEGTATGEEFGYAVAILDDLNGDGTADYAVSAPGASLSTSDDVGRVEIFHGVDGMPLEELTGNFLDDRFGHALAALGDVDGDGLGDFAVGAPQRTTTLVPKPGYVRVYSGSEFEIVHNILGQGGDDGFGSVLAGVGDWDGDGSADVAIASATSANAATTGSYWQIRSGANASILAEQAGGAAADAYGAALAGLGDVDGDGYLDLGLGAPAGLSGAGYVRVLSGRDGEVLYEVVGAGAGDAFGTSIDALGDVDLDGLPDWCAGASQAPLAGAGYVRAHSGADGGLLFLVQGTSPGDHFGATVAGLGDLDGDGFADFAAGAPRAAGAPGFEDPGYVRIVSGAAGLTLDEIWATQPSPGFGASLDGTRTPNGDEERYYVVAGDPGATTDDGQTGLAEAFWIPQPQLEADFADSGGFDAPLTAHGGDSHAELGHAVAILDDIDGDGVRELALGAPYAGDDGRGAVYVLSGADATVLAALEGAGPTAAFGSSLARIGDVDGDGRADFAVGSPLYDDHLVPGVDIGRVDVYASRLGTPHLFHLVGGESGDRFGDRIADLEDDLDGDGRTEFLVASSFSDGPTLVNGGSVRVVSGAQGDLLFEVAGAGGEFACGLASVGDVDGDGMKDFAVGSPLAQNGAGAATGVVHVYSGDGGAELLELVGWEVGSRFGAALGALGDTDGDGSIELAVGAPSESGMAEESGAVYVLSLGSTEFPRIVRGSWASDHFGAALASIPSVDGDGARELIVGAPQFSGAGKAGYVQLLSGASMSLLRTYWGDVTGDRFGAAVAGLDVDSDGLADVLAGMPMSDEFGAYAGGARLHRTGQSEPLMIEGNLYSPAKATHFTMRMDFGPTQGGAFYLVLGALLQGSGFHVDGQFVPLDPADPYFMALLASPGSFVSGAVGLLDDLGRANSALKLPGWNPDVDPVAHAILSFYPLHHAVLVVDPYLLRVDEVSNVVVCSPGSLP